MKKMKSHTSALQVENPERKDYFDQIRELFNSTWEVSLFKTTSTESDAINQQIDHRSNNYLGSTSKMFRRNWPNVS
jgi:hypothetical protein